MEAMDARSWRFAIRYLCQSEWVPNLFALRENGLITAEEHRSLSTLSTAEQTDMLLYEIFPKKKPTFIQHLCAMLCETGREDIVDVIVSEIGFPQGLSTRRFTAKARYVDVPSEEGKRLSSTSKDLSESDDSTPVIALNFNAMTLIFRKTQTLQKDIGEAGGVIASESFTVAIPPGAIVDSSLRTGFTVYEYQPEESKNADDDTEVTDIIVLHPCGTKFAKNVKIKMNYNSSQQSDISLLYEGPDVGVFYITSLHRHSVVMVNRIEAELLDHDGVGMTASLSPSSIDISTKHFCKLFACLFGCAGHCYRPLAFGRWIKGESLHTATIDLHFTSSKSSYVDHVERCNKGLPQLLKGYNVMLFFSLHDPIRLKITRISSGWELISTPPKEIPKRELTQAKKSPSKYCSRSFTLKRILEDADDPWLEVQLTGGKKTDCLLTLKEYTSSPVASNIEAAGASLSGVGETTLGNPATDDQIRQLHIKIEAFWKRVANFLGPTPLTDNEIDQIRKSRDFDDDADRSKAMLNKWQKKQKDKGGKSGTVGDVLKALLHSDVGLRDVAEEVFSKAAVDCYYSKDK